MYEPGIAVRKAVEADVEILAALITRFYLFNEEFDPAMETAYDIREKAAEIAMRRIAGNDLLLVATYEDKIIGYVYGVLLENPLLSRKKIGILKELYVVPEERGHGVATVLIEAAMRDLSSIEVQYVAVEFPTRNVVAEKFYKKLGFREYMSLYLKEV